MPGNNTRQDFEAWAAKHFRSQARLHTGPCSSDWDTWQAATALATELERERWIAHCEKEAEDLRRADDYRPASAIAAILTALRGQ